MQDEDGHSPYDAERAALTARYGHLGLIVRPEILRRVKAALARF